MQIERALRSALPGHRFALRMIWGDVTLFARAQIPLPVARLLSIGVVADERGGIGEPAILAKPHRLDRTRSAAEYLCEIAHGPFNTVGKAAHIHTSFSSEGTVEPVFKRTQ